jgi:hypothetical protein
MVNYFFLYSILDKLIPFAAAFFMDNKGKIYFEKIFRKINV